MNLHQLSKTRLAFFVKFFSRAADLQTGVHRGGLAMSLMVFLLAVSCSSEPGIDKGKFTKLNGTARAVKTSFDRGESYKQLAQQVQILSQAITVLDSGTTKKKEKELLNAYSDLLAMYKDGLLLLKYKLEFAPFDFVPKGRIYVGQDVEPIAFKYHFPTESHIYQPTGQSWKSLSEDSIQIILTNADVQLKIIGNMTNY